MSKSFCPACGKRVAANATVCRACGANVGTATALMPPPDAETALVRPSRARRGSKAARPSTQNRILDDLRSATRGEYEIISEIGRGGMATVYLARDLSLDRKVAIKVMLPAMLHGDKAMERFRREARTAAALSHPHIIPVYAVRESGDLLYFVMKFVEGRPLDALIREQGRLPVETVVRILSEVAGALGHAHRRGVIHRDVKPANIMLDDDGWAIVTDFGIAKLAQAHGLTVSGATVGTPAYMSPEQCMAREVTGQSDQYSLGVVAYELLTGRVPFVADSMLEMFNSHVNTPPPPLPQLCPECPAQLAAVVERMIAKNPEDRWPSLDDVVTALAGLQGTSGERARDSVAAPAQEQPESHASWMPLLVWTAILLPMIALIAWLAYVVGL
jgi:serine/threonine protein kinase